MPENTIKAGSLKQADGKPCPQINSLRKFNQKISKGKPCGSHKAQNILRGQENEAGIMSTTL